MLIEAQLATSVRPNLVPAVGIGKKTRYGSRRERARERRRIKTSTSAGVNECVMVKWHFQGVSVRENYRVRFRTVID